MTAQYIEIHRKELYKQVWKEAIVKLAPKYGLSDNGLRKICKKLRVPTPPLGYWAKIQHGIKVDKPRLPKLKPGEDDTYIFYKRPEKQKDAETEPVFSDEAMKFIKRVEALPSIRVNKTLSSSNPMVIKTGAILKKCEIDKFGIPRHWGKDHLDIRVTPKLLHRSLRIMHSLLKLFDKWGFKYECRSARTKPNTSIQILGEKVYFYLQEHTHRVPHRLTETEKKELKRYPDSDFHKYDYIPSGILTLRIDRWTSHGYIRREWNDTKNRPVEDHLKDFVINLIKAAENSRIRKQQQKEQELRWEEERRRRQELERQRQIEEQRRLDLENQAKV